MTLSVCVSLHTQAKLVRVKWTHANQANALMGPPVHQQPITVTTSALALLDSLVATVRMTSMSAPTAPAEMGPPASILMAAMSASVAKAMKAVTASSTQMIVLPHPALMVAPALMALATLNAFVWMDLVETFAKKISMNVHQILVKMEQPVMTMLTLTRKSLIKKICDCFHFSCTLVFTIETFDL